MKDKIIKSQLVLENVSHNYGAVTVLNNLNLVVNSGEVLVLVGPSGCGKTTLLNLLSGHIKPSSGIIKREGIILTVYQQDGLFPWLTVVENISLGFSKLMNDAEREAELKELIELIHLNGFEQYYPHQLSGGMKQRVEIARVLAGDSDILLMDEPFSALDYQTRLRMRFELIRILKQKQRTVVFVTHDIEEATQLADRILVLTNRPTTISCELTIKSPRPRNHSDPSVINAITTILQEMKL